jgi:hypothetical protein
MSSMAVCCPRPLWGCYSNLHTSKSFYTRINNFSNTSFSNEETKILELGLNCAIERSTKTFLQDLIIDTDNAIKQLDRIVQNIYRFLACKKIKQIQNSNIINTVHKRQSYVIKQIRTKLIQNILIITKADKGKTIVIMNKETYTRKVCDFLRDNQIIEIHKDPTEKYQKQVQEYTTLHRTHNIRSHRTRST